MAKRKSSKSGTLKSKKRKDTTSFNNIFDSVVINDESWRCMVTMIVESTESQEKYLSLINSLCDEGKRKYIYCLNYEKLRNTVENLSKSNFGQNVVFQGIFDQASKILPENNSLPAKLAAQIIKYIIYGEKLNNIEKADEAFIGLVCRRGDSGQVNSEADTKHVEHNEEWQYVDCTSTDRPLNGPNLYVILTGFHDPDLPAELIITGVPLTCILQLEESKNKVSEETTYSSANQFLNRRTLDISKDNLHKFWSSMEVHRTNEETRIMYEKIAFLKFSLNGIPDDYSNEVEKQKMELYDKLCFTLYEVSNLHEMHIDYLGSMKLENGIIDEKLEECDWEFYQTILDAVPQEFVTVPFILQAILLQVEVHNDGMPNGNIQKSSFNKMGSGIHPGREFDSSESGVESFVREKLKKLNAAYEVRGEFICKKEESPSDPDPEVILQGDILGLIVRHLRIDDEITKFGGSIDQLQDISEVLYNPRILTVWHQHGIEDRKKLEKYSKQLKSIRNYFDFRLELDDLQHYLHLLAFDKMIFDGRSSKTNEVNVDENVIKRSRSDQAFDIGRRSSLPSTVPSLKKLKRRSQSVPTSTSMLEQAPSRWKSDSLIDHCKSVPSFADCSVLLDLTDPREYLAPGYLQENLFSKRRSSWSPLEEYDYVETLSTQLFPQVIYDSLINFDQYEIEYFQPTDSILLRFWNENKPNTILREDSVSKIRTPVCFREFCDHVVDIGEWMGCGSDTCEIRRRLARFMENRQQRGTDSIDKDLSKVLKDPESNISIAKEAQIISTVSNESTTKKSKKQSKIDKKTSERSKKKSEGITRENISVREKRETETSVVGTVVSPSRRTEEEKPYAFIGYDLGSLRVQVLNRKTKFLAADGTMVRVELEHWLHKAAELRILVTIEETNLRFFHRIPNCQVFDPFHLTTRTGIILAFWIEPAPTKSKDERSAPMSVQFQSSWPSGLMIKRVLITDPENPFYIHQSFISQNRGNSDINREVCRKFLKNGTILKYLNDGTISVLRPNGDIVTCMEFRKSEHKDTVSENDISSEKSGKMRKESMLSMRHGKKEASPFKLEVSTTLGEISVDKKQDSMTVDQSQDGVSSMTEVVGKLEVSRYMVVNHDGRRYEVLDNLVVSEHHRLLVRTATDYEVNEKFTRRDDGTNMLLNSNGELIVTFPDGTRITTGYIIEESPVVCDWSEEESIRFFSSKEREMFSEFESASSSTSKLYEGDWRKSEESIKMTEILIADGFVSILLTCRMEHKNYATVCYDHSAVNCILSMPDDLQVSITREGHYEVSMANVNLKVQRDAATLSNKPHASCAGRSTSTYNFRSTISDRGPRIIFTTKDPLGNVLQVDEEGSISYLDQNRPMDLQNSKSNDQNLNLCQCDLKNEMIKQNERNKSEEIEGSIDEVNQETDRVNYREEMRWLCQHCRRRCRLFAMKRDLTGYEYLHRSHVRQHEVNAATNNKTSMILYSISRQPERRWLVTMEPVEVQPRSKKLQHSLERIEQTKFDGRELLRSTYSLPYDWLFPFGKNGNGISQNSHDVPLAARIGRPIPKLLKIRILYGFNGPDGNPLVDLQRALAGYWITLFGSSSQYPSVPMRNEERREVWADFKNWEHDLRDLALGVKTKIDASTYIKGLKRSRKIELDRPIRKQSRLPEILEQRSHQEEEFLWYKNCLKHNFVLPYFQNIPGACFLWLQELVSNVSETFEDHYPFTAEVSPDEEEEELNVEIWE